MTLQDGPTVHEMHAREVHGEEKARWWALAVAAWPAYADYQAKTDRQIPVVVLEPTDEIARIAARFALAATR